MIDGRYLRQLALLLLLVSLVATVYVILRNGLRSVLAMSPQLILLTIATAVTAACCSDTKLL